MNLQFRPICDVIATLAASAQTIADDFFAHHATMIDWVAGGPPDQEAKRPVLIARSEVGRSQQHHIADILDHLDRLSASTPVCPELRACIHACRATYSNGTPCHDGLASHRSAFRELTDAMIQLAAAMPDPAPGEVLLLADLATLLEFPAVESWSFPQFDSFTLVLPTDVAHELQSLGPTAPVETACEQPAAALGRLQALCRQGGFGPGTSGISAKVRVHVQPLEPVLDAATDWLDPTAGEDRLVARAIRLNREHPRCVVAIVTRDGRLQARAEDARLDTLPPPGCTAPARARVAEWP